LFEVRLVGLAAAVLGNAVVVATAERGGVESRSAVIVTKPRDLETAEWVC
jgi:hypothetical protein